MSETAATYRPMRIRKLYSERIDARRRREYALNLSVIFDFGSEFPSCRKCSIIYEHQNQLLDLLQDLPYIAKNSSRFDQNLAACPKCGQNSWLLTGIVLGFWLKASSPKYILSESEACWAIANETTENKNRRASPIGGYRYSPLSLEMILTKRTTQFASNMKLLQLKTYIAKSSSDLAVWLSKQVDRTARLDCAWQERLNSLVEDLKLHQQQALNAIIQSDSFQQKLETLAGESQRPYFEQIAQLATKAASKILPDALPTFFETVKTGSVKAEDVQLNYCPCEKCFNCACESSAECVNRDEGMCVCQNGENNDGKP